VVLGLVRDWHDGLIPPGADWDKVIRHELEGSDVILLLISVEFLMAQAAAGPLGGIW
jgi:hypothetical protein